MDDAEAYMLLALANTQGELTALERGRHALAALERGVEPDVKAYAKAMGREKERVTVQREVMAAKVADTVFTGEHGLPDPTILWTIHAAPRWLWRVMVKRAVEEGWTVSRAQKAVDAVKGAPDLEPWWDGYSYLEYPSPPLDRSALGRVINFHMGLHPRAV